MHVIAFNGSPHEKGNTYAALRAVTEQLEAAGITAEIVQVGHLPIRGCAACNQCARNKDSRCVLPEDGVNAAIEKIRAADGVLLGAPTYYGDVPGPMKSFLDRVFFAGDYNFGGAFRYKVGAAVAVARRPGGRTTLDCLERYLNCAEMFLPSTTNWPLVYGLKPGDVERDTEGQVYLRALGKNMAWLLQAVALGRAQIPVEPREKRVYLNLIR